MKHLPHDLSEDVADVLYASNLTPIQHTLPRRIQSAYPHLSPNLRVELTHLATPRRALPETTDPASTSNLEQAKVTLRRVADELADNNYQYDSREIGPLIDALTAEQIDVIRKIVALPSVITRNS